MPEIIYKTDLDRVDWAELKATLRQDTFDNGRSPELYAKLGFAEQPSGMGQVIGTWLVNHEVAKN